MRSSICHIGGWNCPKFVHKSKYTWILNTTSKIVTYLGMGHSWCTFSRWGKMDLTLGWTWWNICNLEIRWRRCGSWPCEESARMEDHGLPWHGLYVCSHCRNMWHRIHKHNVLMLHVVFNDWAYEAMSCAIAPLLWIQGDFAQANWSAK